MKKNWIIILLAIILFTSISTQAGFFNKPKAGIPVKSNGQSTQQEKSLESPATSKLSIISYSPQGQLDSYYPIEGQGLNFEIVFTFNDPIVALENLDQQKNRLRLIFTPPIQGTYKWKGTDTLAFRPTSVPDATEIKVTVPAGVVSINDKVLNEPFSWTFQTKRPRLDSSQPYNGSDHADLDQRVWLYFSMPVKQDEVKNYITWKTGLTSVNFTSKVTNNNSVILTPVSKLSIETKYSVTIKKDFPAATGNLGTAQEQRIDFSTHPNLRYNGPSIIEIRPGNSVSLQFSNPLSERNIISNSTLSGYSNHFDLEQFSDEPTSYPYFNFNLPPQTEQVIELSGKITDMYGNKLQNPVKITVKSGDYYPFCNTLSGKGYIESYMAGTIRLNYVNMDKINMSWYRIPKDKIVAYETRSYGLSAAESRRDGLLDRRLQPQQHRSGQPRQRRRPGEGLEPRRGHLEVRASDPARPRQRADLVEARARLREEGRLAEARDRLLTSRRGGRARGQEQDARGVLLSPGHRSRAAGREGRRRELGGSQGAVSNGCADRPELRRCLRGARPTSAYTRTTKRERSRTGRRPPDLAGQDPVLRGLGRRVPPPHVLRSGRAGLERGAFVRQGRRQAPFQHAYAPGRRLRRRRATTAARSPSTKRRRKRATATSATTTRKPTSTSAWPTRSSSRRRRTRPCSSCNRSGSSPARAPCGEIRRSVPDVAGSGSPPRRLAPVARRRGAASSAALAASAGSPRLDVGLPAHEIAQPTKNRQRK